MAESGCESSTGDPAGTVCSASREDLLQKILAVLEFYFSDINLSRNKFLAHKVLEDPYVPIVLLMTFYKLKELTEDEEMVIEAIKLSKMLHLTEDGTKVFRTTEIQPVDQIEEHVIYVENVPENKDHEWLRQIFSTFGQVFYVSLPVFKRSRKNKGFAFVEFASEKDTVKAYEAFQSSDLLIPPNILPEELLSIKTHEEDPTGDVQEVDRLKFVNSIVETRELSQLGMKVMQKGDWRRLRNRFLNRLHWQNKLKKEELGEKEEEMNYKEGLVVKLEKAKQLGNLDDFLAGIRMRPNGGVVFVTNKIKSEFVFIRFATVEQADAFLSPDTPHITKLEGSEEAEYWEEVARIIAAKKEHKNLQKMERRREKRRVKVQNQAGPSSDVSAEGEALASFESLLEQRHADVQEDQMQLNVDSSLRSKRKKKRDRKTGQRGPTNKHIYFEDADEKDDGKGEAIDTKDSVREGMKREANPETTIEEPVPKKACISPSTECKLES